MNNGECFLYKRTQKELRNIQTLNIAIRVHMNFIVYNDYNNYMLGLLSE